MENKNENLEIIRHSLSHILMQSLSRLYGAIPGVGPAIDNGFYHDFDILSPPLNPPLSKGGSEKASSIEKKVHPDGIIQITPDDLPKIEKEMKKIIKANYPIEKKVMPIDEGINFLKEKGYIYTAELAEDLKKEGETQISFYQQAEFINMCKGPHLESTGQINPDAFKLTKLAGAYWKGDEKNKMLQRVYGVAFETKDELEKYLTMMEEAAKRDHRKLGKELDLFSFHPEAQGIPFFHPKGAIIYNELRKFWQESQKEFRYDTVLCPTMLDVAVWEKSGHWAHYKDDMYFIKNEKGEKKFALRPMDCPGAILIYNNSLKSYRDLPLRYAEPGLITRKEKSGQLGGLLRVQQFIQDDAHIFITEKQIKNELKNVIKLVDVIYKPFNLKYKALLSTRPDDFMGDIQVWEKAEKELKEVLEETYGDNYGIKEKDGAFYGPKIDYHLEDSIGRTWQCATIQLDFQMPLKFECKYADKDGAEKTPVLIHRTIMGSFERFTGILIEHFAGAFPVWLSPVQVKIISVGEGHIEFCDKLADEFREQNVRVEIDSNDETVGNKIRKARTEKIPYILVIGDKEMNSDKLHINVRGKKEIIEMTKDEFFGKIKEEIKERTAT